MCDWAWCVCGVQHDWVGTGVATVHPVCYRTGAPVTANPVTSYLFVQAQVTHVKVALKRCATVDEYNNPRCLVTPDAAAVLAIVQELRQSYQPHEVWYDKTITNAERMAIFLAIPLGVPLQDIGHLRAYPPGADQRDRLVVVVLPRCPSVRADVVNCCTFV